MEAPLFDPSIKKKKKSKPVDAPETTALAEATSELSLDAGAPESVGEFEFKKKKKKSKAPAAITDFEKDLADAGIPTDATNTAPSAADEQESVFEKLLTRFFDILRQNNPEMVSDRHKYKIPPPVVLRDGNKKTLFANVTLIAEKMHRPTEHVIHYLFTELGTSGSVDGTNRLVIKGRFQQKQIEGVLRRYIVEYVTCKTCKSVNTSFVKENRLYFLVCNACGSRRSVQSIKSGYQVVTRRSRMKK